jgi:hypothetical protein
MRGSQIYICLTHASHIDGLADIANLVATSPLIGSSRNLFKQFGILHSLHYKSETIVEYGFSISL